MFTSESRRDGWRIIALGVASFLAIFPLCTWRHLEIIEKDLLERSGEALIAAGLGSVEMSISGRDLFIEGITDQDRIRRVEAVLAEVRGVRTIAVRDPDAGSQDGG